MNKYAYNIVAKKLVVLLLAVTIPLTGVSCQKTPEQPAAEAGETSETGEAVEAGDAADDAGAAEAGDAVETSEAAETPETAEGTESTGAAEAIAHGEVTLQEMIDSYHSVDPDALKPQIDLLEKYYQENSEDKNPEETVVKIYKEMCAVYEEQQQQRAISEILSFTDTSDSEMAEKSARDASNLLLLQNQGRSAIRNALNGPYGDALREVIDPKQIHVYFDTVDFTPEMEELANQYTSIVSQYHLAMSQPVTCEFEGVTYASNGELPEENRKEIIKLLCEAREEMIVPIYVELINNRNEFARLLGYDNFLGYSYAQEFNRDYTAEDVKAMLDNIYELCAPLMQSSADRIGDVDMSKSLGMSSEEMLELLDENIEKVSPELDESLDYMMKYKLYSLGNELSDVSSRASWTSINHLFDAPLYYISYAISALSALDVYSEYLKDPQTGWDKYTALTHINPEMKYVEAVSACGLHDMTKEENIREVMETLTSHYNDENEEQKASSSGSGNTY